MSEGVFWDYEDGPDYYHIYVCSGPLEGRMDTIGIEVPQSAENDADVQQIVEALRRIARRIGEKEPPR